MMWPSAVTRSPTLRTPSACGLGAELLDPSGELVADGERGLEPSRGPRVPFPDVEVGAADAGVEHTDEDVLRADGRHGYVADLHAGARGGFDDGSHWGGNIGMGVLERTKESLRAPSKRRNREPGRPGRRY